MLAASVIVLFLALQVTGHGDHNLEMAHKLKELKGRWDVAEVIRDPEHLKEDLKLMLDLSQNDTLSTQETGFYFIKMYDFDDNDGVDGIELVAAIQHIFEHYGVSDLTTERLYEQVDEMLKSDANNDGFLSYAEYMKLGN